MTALQPAMNFLPYTLESVVAEVRAEFFPHLTVETPIVFTEGNRVACIAVDGPGGHQISIHPALSRPETPLSVLRFIVKHELIHIDIPAVRSGRRVLHHPPAFWEREYEIAPESRECWAWLRKTLGEWLVVSHGTQSAEVTVRRRRPRTNLRRSRAGARPQTRPFATTRHRCPAIACN